MLNRKVFVILQAWNHIAAFTLLFFLETLLSFFVVVNFLGTFPIRSIWAYSLQQCCNLSFSSISMLSESSAILSSHELFFLLKKILKHGFCFFFFFGNFPKHGWQNFKHGICSNCEMYLFNFPKHDFCPSEIYLYSCAQLLNVFVQFAKCICSNCKMYLFKLQNVFVSNFKTYLSQLQCSVC